MKNALILIIACVLSLTSCNVVHNSGFPKNMNFGGHGGTRSVQGDYGAYALCIQDENCKALSDNYSVEPGDSFAVSYDWLSVKGLAYDGLLIFTVAPNETGRTRKLYVSGMVMDQGFYIKVTQAGGGL